MYLIRSFMPWFHRDNEDLFSIYLALQPRRCKNSAETQRGQGRLVHCSQKIRTFRGLHLEGKGLADCNSRISLKKRAIKVNM
jgi:hypothetical protein